MKSKPLTISALSIFLLAGGSCSLGDFCAVYQPVPPLKQEIAEAMVAENRSSAVAIATNEASYGRNCGG